MARQNVLPTTPQNGECNSAVSQASFDTPDQLPAYCRFKIIIGTADTRMHTTPTAEDASGRLNNSRAHGAAAMRAGSASRMPVCLTPVASAAASSASQRSLNRDEDGESRMED